jgi:hypothetical protein
LVIPAGALSQRVTITATLPEGDQMRAEFEPHGLQFAAPAELSFDIVRCPAAASANVVYTDDDDSVLENEPTWTESDKHHVFGEISHFSKYALYIIKAGFE